MLFCLVGKPFQLEDNYQDNLAMIAFEQSLVCTVSISTSTSLFDTDHTSAEAGWLHDIPALRNGGEGNNDKKVCNNRFVTIIVSGGKVPNSDAG